GCHIWFDGHYFIWYYEETPCGDNMWFYVDTIFDYSLWVFILLCDTVTLLSIHRHRRRIGRLRKMAFAHTSDSQDSTSSMITREKFWCDVRLFAQ
ncbi:hypothetical protein AAVH_26395, partial [Aphelenchoides avenae]